ncbi:MAG: sulfatase, partial [Roseimicrobium sp.]
MSPFDATHLSLTRRALFGKAAHGLGAAALGSLLTRDGFAISPDSLAPVLPHFAPKAKRVIYLLQNGAPAHVELFDYKPKLKEWHG